MAADQTTLDRNPLRRLLLGEISLTRLIRSLLVIAFGVYAGLFGYVRMLGDRIIFQPPRSTYQDTTEVIKLVSGTADISAIHLKHPNAAYTILYSHGNAEDLGTLRPTLEEIRKFGFSVFAYDYRGYGTSSGISTEETSYRDIDAAYDYLTKVAQVPPNRIIALGRSLGGAIAIDLASRKPLAGLVVESSFVSAYRVLTRFPIYPFDQFKSLAKIGSVHCPVLIMHGTRDEVISFWHGAKLFQAANEPKLACWVEGAGHNNLMDVAGFTYAQTLRKFGDMITMLNSGIWVDRNKAGYLLNMLTMNRDPGLLSRLRRQALASLIEMAQWREFGHAESARFILGRIAGFAESDLQRLAAENVQTILNAFSARD